MARQKRKMAEGVFEEAVHYNMLVKLQV